MQSKSLPADLAAGFSVFLIALPLCLGISLASGFPATAGLLTAIVGGVLGSLLSRAALTIKGPAAGLIVIALGAVTDLGQGDVAKGYTLTLGVCVIAGLIQVAFALLKLGRFVDLCPPTPVHGMMAAIGIIIGAKQIHLMLGIKPTAMTPLALLQEIPESIAHLNPEIAAIGAATILALIIAERLRKRFPRLAPPLLAVAVAVPLGAWFDLSHEHTFAFLGHSYGVGPQWLLHVPKNFLASLGRPDFSAVLTPRGFTYVIMFSLVGSLESLLSARAIDRLDPQKRRTDLNNDLLATGIGNVIAAGLGGLPMISEIVRSSANAGAGAKTRAANFFHGVFMAAVLLVASSMLEWIPLASLAGLLVYTGARLASPRQVRHLIQLGGEQLAVFAITVIVTLATDLLMGVFAGIVMEVVVLWSLSHSKLFGTRFVVNDEGVTVTGPLTFLNLGKLQKALASTKGTLIDVSQATLIDHATMLYLSRFSELRVVNASALQPMARSEVGLHMRKAAA